MTAHYIILDVSPDAVCSYPRGKSLLLRHAFATEDEAQRTVDRFNECRHYAVVDTIRYSVFSCEETLDAAKEAGCDQSI